jgi:hypothetical protein
MWQILALKADLSAREFMTEGFEKGAARALTPTADVAVSCHCPSSSTTATNGAAAAAAGSLIVNTQMRLVGQLAEVRTLPDATSIVDR